MINKSVRRMERERRKLLSTEKKYLAELKVLARQNNHSAAKILIKDLTRLRKQCDQYLLMQSQLKSIGFQVSTLQAQTEVNAALRGATETMTRVNETMDVKEIQEVMKQFVRNVEKMGVNMDLMEDALDNGESDIVGDADQAYEQLLSEIGLEIINGETVPTNKLRGSGEKSDIKNIEQQLQDLKS
eukprot:TRINITY_DN3185_c0_g2_i8.p1 TRINITY_DN3185_c0_g2~~TRINITY_DN3185_c0_g2_i8.p1  ORF type:complete len:186 (-),score=46.24 TRINITY_DN3185_c0_g2_i8:123-680(-)